MQILPLHKTVAKLTYVETDYLSTTTLYHNTYGILHEEGTHLQTTVPRSHHQDLIIGRIFTFYFMSEYDYFRAEALPLSDGDPSCWS